MGELNARAGRRRLAVVLFNLGGPDSLDAVQPFLFNLFNDPAIIGLPALPRRLLAGLIANRRKTVAADNYRYMGGASPLLRETEAQAKALAAKLAETTAGQEIKVFIAMRYWRPLTKETARAVEVFAPDEIVLLPLYPQYSTTTTASSLKAWRDTYRGPGTTHTVCCWFDGEGWIAASAHRIRETYEAAGRPSPIRILFSAHGLPMRVVERGDPYQQQVERAAAAVAARLAQDWPEGELDWQVCYQSRVGPLKWLGPYTPAAIAAAAEEGRGVLVVPVAFVSEHLETLVELDRDYAELARNLGCAVYLRAPAVGVESGFIDGLAKLVEDALNRNGVAPGGSVCGGRWAGCPFQARGERLA